MEAAKHIVLKGGAKMPKVGFGTWKMENEEKDIEVLKHALKIGYRHFDTAEMYKCEEAVGKTVKDGIESGLVKREDVFITTKVWMYDFHRVEDALQVLTSLTLNLLG